MLHTKEILNNYVSFSKHIFCIRFKKQCTISRYFFRDMQRFYVDVNAKVTKHNPRFGTRFFPNNALYLFSFSFFFFLLVHPVLVGRILRMQLHHFYIVATSRIITRGIYIYEPCCPRVGRCSCRNVHYIFR